MANNMIHHKTGYWKKSLQSRECVADLSALATNGKTYLSLESFHINRNCLYEVHVHYALVKETLHHVCWKGWRCKIY